MKIIAKFEGNYRFLSNFSPCFVKLDGVTYPSIENAYQAAKTSPENRKPFVTCSASQSKKLGREVTMRSDWEDIKVSIMSDLIAQKFTSNNRLGELLLNTGDAILIEGNHWNDTFWGVCNNVGKNMLGKLLMQRRKEIKVK